MYVCVFAFVCIYIYICRNIYIYIYICVCVCVLELAYVFACLRANLSTLTHTNGSYSHNPPAPGIGGGDDYDDFSFAGAHGAAPITTSTPFAQPYVCRAPYLFFSRIDLLSCGALWVEIFFCLLFTSEISSTNTQLEAALARLAALRQHHHGHD